MSCSCYDRNNDISSLQLPSSSCFVTDPFNETFDLSSLTKYHGNYVVSGGGHWYELNVCAALNGGRHEGCRNDASAICQGDLQNKTFHDGGKFAYNK